MIGLLLGIAMGVLEYRLLAAAVKKIIGSGKAPLGIIAGKAAIAAVCLIGIALAAPEHLAAAGIGFAAALTACAFIGFAMNRKKCE